MLHGLSRLVNRFLQKIADQNRRQFGDRRMDCCRLNRDAPGRPTAAAAKKSK
jgi:hypothetical protein